MDYTVCSLCKTQGHNAMKCPDLCDPLKPGFHSGGGGGGGHGGDDDETLSINPVARAPPHNTLKTVEFGNFLVLRVLRL